MPANSQPLPRRIEGVYREGCGGPFRGKHNPSTVKRGCNGGSASHCRPHAMFFVFPVFTVCLAEPLLSQNVDSCSLQGVLVAGFEEPGEKGTPMPENLY